jgi:hypothetical protein
MPPVCYFRSLGPAIMRESGMAAIPSRDVTVALDRVVRDWYGGITSSVARLPLVVLGSAIELVEMGRVRRAREVLNEYRANLLLPFIPVLDCKAVPHLGILVEKSANGLLILDGTHRAYAAQQAGATHVGATIITPHQPLPGPSELVLLSSLREVSDGGEPKFLGQDVKLFRPASTWLERWRDAIRSEIGRDE